MLIITNKNFKILNVLDTIEFVDTNWVKLHGDNLIQLDMVIITEVESIPEDVEYYKDGVFTELCQKASTL